MPSLLMGINHQCKYMIFLWPLFSNDQRKKLRKKKKKKKKGHNLDFCLEKYLN